VIAPPEGWRRVASVGADVYANPDRSMQIRYRSRLAPLRRVASIVEDVLRELPEWRTRRASARERFATREGEHAFGVSLIGAWTDRDAHRYIGIVYGDDSYDVLDMVAFGTEPLEARARVLLHSATLQLGVRRRRYFHDCLPAGWHGHATGLTTHWFPPTFPARPSTIVVYPANPTNERPIAVYQAMAASPAASGGELHELAPPAEIAAKHGLEGLHWQLCGVTPGRPPVVRDLVVFARRSFTYALQLDSLHHADADACAVFFALARSVEPVPAGGILAANAASAFGHLV